MASSDLRRLMKLKQSSSSKINHPLAKYNLDQLTCIICNKVIKNEAIWSAHLQSKKHKENIILLKSKPATTSPAAATSFQKRSIVSDTSVKETPPKKAKTDLPADFFDSGIPVSAQQSKHKETEAKIDSHESNDLETGNKKIEDSNISSIEKKTLEINGIDKKGSSNRNIKMDGNIDQLPEGFFDDPKKDAKARNVEYKDPKEEEWEKFQKMIQEETKVAETIQEEEDEESEMHKDMIELNKMRSCLSRVENLKKLIHRSNQSKVATKREEVIVQNAAHDSSNESDEDIDIGFDWRAKMA